MWITEEILQSSALLEITVLFDMKCSEQLLPFQQVCPRESSLSCTKKKKNQCDVLKEASWPPLLLTVSLMHEWNCVYKWASKQIIPSFLNLTCLLSRTSLSANRVTPISSQGHQEALIITDGQLWQTEMQVAKKEPTPAGATLLDRNWILNAFGKDCSAMTVKFSPFIPLW